MSTTHRSSELGTDRSSPPVDATSEPIGRVERKRRQKIQDILSVASELLGERGYENTNLEDIAERLDLTKASLYHYFDSKEALLTACLERVAEESYMRFGRVIGEYENETEAVRFQALVRAHLIMILRDFPHLTELFTHRLDWPIPYVEQIKAMRIGHDQFFREVVAAGVESGEFKIDDLGVVLHCLYGAINAVPVWFSRSSAKDIDRLCDSMMPTLLRMLGWVGAESS